MGVSADNHDRKTMSSSHQSSTTAHQPAIAPGLGLACNATAPAASPRSRPRRTRSESTHAAKSNARIGWRRLRP